MQYGKRIGAFVLYLLHYQLLPEQRLAMLMADLFGVPLATATIARISQDCAERFQRFAEVVRDHVAAAAVKHMDGFCRKFSWCAGSTRASEMAYHAIE